MLAESNHYFVVAVVFLASFFGAVFLLLCGYFGNTTVSAVSLLTVAVGLQGCALAGFNINHLDIAPRFSGLLMGITNMVATIPGIVGPIVAKAITHEVCTHTHTHTHTYTRMHARTLGQLRGRRDEWSLLKVCVCMCETCSICILVLQLQ